MKKKQVILVTEQDEVMGTMEKMQAHEKGLLHRAFSVFIFNSRGELLLQRRALDKYHSAGLWTNTCCSHPTPGEDTLDAATKRLEEEMGFSVPLEKVFDFVYRADFSNGLTEHEFDHVFAGEYESEIRANPEEVMDYSYKTVADIRQLLNKHPEQFTPWFRLAFPKIEQWWRERY
jgi:isopentenyl-diphosphate Delta-isomerase